MGSPSKKSEDADLSQRQANRRRLYIKYPLIAVLLGLFRPLVVVFVLFGVVTIIVKPAWMQRLPQGGKYLGWVLALIFLAPLSLVPFARIKSIADALSRPDVGLSVLFTTVIVYSLFIWLMFRATQNAEQSQYLPFRNFRVNPGFILALLFSASPLVWGNFEGSFAKPHTIHPLLLAIVASIKPYPVTTLILGIVGLGIIVPIFEEMVFRGLLFEPIRNKLPTEQQRIWLDISVCLFFALLHLPRSFVTPLLLSFVFISFRKSTNSLLPSTILHAVWNISITVGWLHDYGALHS